MKKCNECGNDKELTEFNKDKKMKDGYLNKCKLCCKTRYKESIEKCQERYRIKHKDKINEKNRNRYNPDYQKEFNDNYYKSHTKEIIENKKKYNLDNKEKFADYNKQYRNNYKSRRNELIKERYSKDILFKLNQSIRRNIHYLLKKNGFTKNNRTFEILGCSFEEFKTYIESKFQIWMSWENHGKYTGDYNETWQLDHIIPSDTAITENDVIRLNHFTNLQPLCSKKNLEKSNKLDYK